MLFSQLVLAVLEMSCVEGRSCLTRRLQDEAVVFALLQSKPGREVFLRVALKAQQETVTRVWHLLQPDSLDLLARHQNCYIIQRIVEEKADKINFVSHFVSSKELSLMIMTRHCIGLIEVIAEKTKDDQLPKIVNWITSNLSMIISNQVGSQASCAVLEELYSECRSTP